MLGRAKRQLRRLLKSVVQTYGERAIEIKEITLVVDYSEVGGQAYAGRSSHEEYASVLYDEIASVFAPGLVIDIGANYGFTGLVFAKRFPNARIVLVEPSPYLCGLIHRNFRTNGIKKYEVIQAMCGEAEDKGSMFSINPHDSQDNRVVGLSGWKSIQVPTRSLSAIVDENYESGNVFIKIDTQGFEERVFRGAHGFLSTNDNWLIKSEFAPDWLKSQATNPVDFLRYLISNFSVIEAPSRYRFKGDSLNRLFSEPLTVADAESFVAHISSLDAGGRGWCDLLIRSKAGVN